MAPAKFADTGQMIPSWERLVQAVPDAVVVTEAEPIDEPGPRIVYANTAFEKMTGWRAEEVLGLTPRILQSPETDRRELDRLRAALRAREPVVVELHNQRKDGSPFWVELSITPVSVDGGPLWTHLLSVQRDVTTRKAAEFALLEKTRELEQARKDAERASLAKSAFLANVSHEIRTPLNGVLGMAEILAETPLDAEQRTYLDTVKSSGEALLGVISDVLDYAKIEAGRVELESVPFSPRRVVEIGLSVVAAQAFEKGLELVAIVDDDVPESVTGDPNRFQQVLVNLLGNAAKFTHDGFIEVRLRHQDGQLVIEVEDSGIGIAEDRQERLFEMFEQADSSTTRRYGGTGLGLAIVQRIVGLAGGQISIHSIEGEGSTFRVEFPLEALPSTAPMPVELRACVAVRSQRLRSMTEAQLRHEGVTCVKTPEAADLVFFERGTPLPELPGARRVQIDPPGSTAPGLPHRRLLQPVTSADLRRVLWDFRSDRPQLQPAPSATKLRVLVAEDNPVNAKVVTLALERMGHEVELATDGIETLEQLSRSSFQLVLMDLQMPGLSGLQVTEKYRAQGGKIPIIALTADADLAERDACLSAGMQDYLTKPLSLSRLRSTLSHLAENQATNKDEPPSDTSRAEALGEIGVDGP